MTHLAVLAFDAYVTHA